MLRWFLRASPGRPFAWRIGTTWAAASDRAILRALPPGVCATYAWVWALDDAGAAAVYEAGVAAAQTGRSVRTPVQLTLSPTVALVAPAGEWIDVILEIEGDLQVMQGDRARTVRLSEVMVALDAPLDTTGGAFALELVGARRALVWKRRHRRPGPARDWPRGRGVGDPAGAVRRRGDGRTLRSGGLRTRSRRECRRIAGFT